MTGLIKRILPMASEGARKIAIAVIAIVAAITIYRIYIAFHESSSIENILLSRGVSQSTASFFSFVINLFVLGTSTFSVIWIFLGRANWKHWALAISLPCLHWLISFIPADIDARSGETIKWCASRPGGQEFCQDYAGFDPQTGQKLRPVTRQNSEARFRRVNGLFPKRIDKPIDQIEFFDGISGEPKVWISPDGTGCYNIYDNPGVDPKSGSPLQPISHDIGREIINCKSPVNKRVSFEIRDFSPSAICGLPGGHLSFEIPYIQALVGEGIYGVSDAIIVNGNPVETPTYKGSSVGEIYVDSGGCAKIDYSYTSEFKREERIQPQIITIIFKRL